MAKGQLSIINKFSRYRMMSTIVAPTHRGKVFFS